jgi:hypothetical protein
MAGLGLAQFIIIIIIIIKNEKNSNISMVILKIFVGPRTLSNNFA